MATLQRNRGAEPGLGHRPRSVGDNESGNSRRRRADREQKGWNKRPEVSKPVGLGLKHNNGQREAIEVLLKGQILIDSDEHIEVLRGKGQQLSVLDRRPPHLTGSLHVVTDDVARDANRRIRREKPSRSRFDHALFRFLQESDHMLARHRRKPFEKLIDRFARLQAIEQGLHGNPGPVEHSSASHHVGAARYNRLLHVRRLRRNGLPVQHWAATRRRVKPGEHQKSKVRRRRAACAFDSSMDRGHSPHTCLTRATP